MGFFSKRRKKARAKRGYAAADSGRLFADWTTTNRTADAELRTSLKKMRARSRELERNNDYIRRYFGLLKNNVVGASGIVLQARMQNDAGKQDEADNSRLEAAWKDWGRRGTCTIDGRHSLVSLQKLVISSQARDGEVLIRHVRGRAAGNAYGYAVQVLEADLLDEDYSDDARNGNRIVMSVEINAANRPVAYHLLAEHPGEDSHFAQGRHRIRVPASEIEHIYDAERATQTRGIPWAVTAMTRLQQLGGYEEAELVAARIAACKMGFFTSPDGDGYDGDGEDGDGNLITEASPGTFEQLPSGTEMSSFDPQHPTSQFEAFERAILRGIASGLGVSYNALANDLTSVNYSSIRQGALEDRDAYRLLQGALVEQLLDPIYRAWLDMVIVTDLLPMPPRRYDKALAVQWQPRGWSWVDPQKEIKAQIDAINAGLRSRTDALAETGRDITDTFQSLAAEQQLAESLGLQLGEANGRDNQTQNTDQTGDD